MSPKQHRYYRTMLISICEHLQIQKENQPKAMKILHAEFKKCFEVDSFKNVTVAEFEKIAAIIRMIMLREFQIFVKEPDEEHYSPEDMTMGEFLKLKKLI